MSLKHPFAMGITRLRKEPASVLGFELSGRMDDLRVASSYVGDDELIDVVGIAESVHGGILITATISAGWKGECRRCLGVAVGRLEISLRELFEREETGAQRFAEGDTYPYSGDVLDLQEMIKDQVLLELPLAPLCKGDCKGLCATCGKDLNLGPCGCGSTPVDLGWSALDALVDKDR